ETYTVYYFVSRHRDEHPLVSMRHLLLSVTTKEDGSSDAEQVYEEIQGLYSQWQNSGYSESTFADLVAKNTDDTGSKTTGGLYESFAYGTMVSEINDWLYAEGRKLNDSAIIKTTFGYHIVWFTGYGEIAWKSKCLPGLQDEDYYKLLEGLKEPNPVTFRTDYRDVVAND
ncbi:MAG: peptidylprolyl isomerase, partial [Clostridia bacterium]|nr:peptidylprolyl isomerase [Clostridia bacterium]